MPIDGRYIGVALEMINHDYKLIVANYSSFLWIYLTKKVMACGFKETVPPKILI